MLHKIYYGTIGYSCFERCNINNLAVYLYTISESINISEANDNMLSDITSIGND